jgi:uncharacterized protein
MKKSKNKGKSKKVKILAVGDIHGDSGLTKKLAEIAKKENVDLVILAGDLTFAETSTKDIIGPFVKAKKKVLLIPGNHETFATADFLAQSYPDTKNIHGYSFIQEDLGVFGAGGAVGFNTSEKEIFEALKKGNSSLKGINKKIMVTHMHHKGSKAEFSGFEGSKAVTKAIKEFKPDLLINAHIHEAGGIEEKIGKTRIINVSRSPGIFEI